MPRLLVMTCDADERQLLRGALSYRADLTFINTLQQLEEQIERLEYDVVFCDRDLLTSDWRSVLEDVKRMDPSLPVVVLSPSGKQEEWLEAITDGAFDLLSSPYLASDVFPLVEHAAASHEARFMHESVGYVPERAS